MLNTIWAYKKNKQFLLIAFFALIIAGCATNTIDSRFTVQTPAELMNISHQTPSTAEKIQIRAYLAKRFPDTAEGMYAKTYIAYQNDQRELELKYLAEMAKKYPDEVNSLHYQSFEGDFEERLALTKHALELHPSFLNYNFIVILSDIYTQNEGVNFEDFYALMDHYEQKLGEDLYVFDFARGLVDQKITKDLERANKLFTSALSKRGGKESWKLWESYFETKYPQGIKNDDGYDDDYIEEIQLAVNDVNKLSASALLKKSISHKLVKNLLADQAESAGHSGAYLLYKEASHHYFTAEVVSDLRTVLINRGDEDDLLALFQDGVKQLPNNPDTLGLLADELAYQKDYQQADIYFKRAFKNSHVYTDKRYYLNQYANSVLYPTYRADEAFELLQNLATSYPDKASGLNEEFALAKMYMGDHKEAKTYFETFKANWEGGDEHFPKYRESIVNEFAERDLAINGENEEKSEVVSTPTMVATTSVFTDWLTVSPDRRYFLANNGEGAYVQWDVDELSVVDTFEDAILSSDYTKYMTKPVISPDGRYFAYATEFEDDLGSVTMIYDTQERRFSHQLPMIKKTSGMAWSPDSEELVIWNYGRLIKYNLDDEEVVQQGEVKGQDGADTMLWTPNGKYLALLERSSDGSIRIFDADTLEQLHRLEQVSWPHALGMSFDGRYIFSADNQSTLHKWDTEKEFAHETVEIPVLGRIIAPHPTKPQIVINDWRGRNYLTLIDYEKMEVIETQRTGDAELRISYIGNADKILAANLEDDSYEIYDATSLELIDLYTGESAVVTGGAYANAARNQLVTWDQDGLHVWSVTTGKKLHSWPGDFHSVMVDPENSDLIYALENDQEEETTYIGKFNLSDFMDELFTQVDFVVDKWSMDSGKLIMSGRPYMPMDEGFFIGIALSCDLAAETCSTLFVDMVTGELEYEHLGDTRFTQFAVSPDQKHVALSTAWEDGWKQGETLSEITQVYDFEQGELVQTFEHVGQLVFKDNDTLAIEGEGGLYGKSTTYSIKSGKETGVLGEDYIASTIASHDGWPDDVSFPERNLSVNVSNDNRIEFYNAKDDELALTILAKRDDNWIAFLPTGEFSSPENGVDKVYWQLDGKKLSMSEAIEKYKRDDVIETKLQAISGQ